MHPRDLPVLAPSDATSRAVPMLSHEYEEPAISPAQIGAILWAYRKISVLIAAAIVVAVGVGCMLWPRTYEATATLMVNFDVYDPLSGREFPIGLLGSYMATQVELARGSEVLLPVIERLQLTRSKTYIAGYKGGATGLPHWVETLVRKRLLVEQGRFGSQLIYLRYAASSAEEAAQVANTVADVYAEQQHQRLTGPASDRAQRYTAQLGELKAKVDLAQDEVSAFRSRSGVIDSDLSGDVSLQLLTTLEHRLQEIQNVRRVAQTRADADASVGSEVLGSTMIQSLKTQLALQNSQMAELRASLGGRHPQVQALQAQINVTQRALGAEQSAYSGNARDALVAATRLEGQIQAAAEEQRAKVAAIRQLQDDGAKYQLALESAQTVYKRALEGYDQVMFASTGGYTNISFVSRAVPPPRPSKPKVMLAMLLAVIAGGGLGLVLPIVYELFNRRIRCRDDLERDHGIPVLAELGHIGPTDPAFPVPYGR
jgi:polysaccharide biosynthesis transport protein